MNPTRSAAPVLLAGSVTLAYAAIKLLGVLLRLAWATGGLLIALLLLAKVSLSRSIRG